MSREHACVGSQGHRGEEIDEITMTEGPWTVNGGEGHEWAHAGVGGAREAMREGRCFRMFMPGVLRVVRARRAWGSSRW